LNHPVEVGRSWQLPRPPEQPSSSDTHWVRSLRTVTIIDHAEPPISRPLARHSVQVRPFKIASRFMLTTLSANGCSALAVTTLSAAPETGWPVTPTGRIHTAHLVPEGNKRTFDLCSHLMMNSNNQVSERKRPSRCTYGWSGQALASKLERCPLGRGGNERRHCSIPQLCSDVRWPEQPEEMWYLP
jgi:hypothetical protein